jgi:hypothetical protein
MAFRWWKKKSRPSQGDGLSHVLELSDADYAKFIADFVDNMDGATRAHVAVAYQNLIPILSAIYSHNRKHGSDFTTEEFIKGAAERVDELVSDEINSRRNSWFLFAAMIARLEKIARRDESVIPISATIWTKIATEYPRLKILLPHNVVWSDDEKAWFSFSDDDSDLIGLAVNHHIPTKFAKHPITERFAKSMDLFYWPSETRIGYVP